MILFHGPTAICCHAYIVSAAFLSEICKQCMYIISICLHVFGWGKNHPFYTNFWPYAALYRCHGDNFLSSCLLTFHFAPSTFKRDSALLAPPLSLSPFQPLILDLSELSAMEIAQYELILDVDAYLSGYCWRGRDQELSIFKSLSLMASNFCSNVVKSLKSSSETTILIRFENHC